MALKPVKTNAGHHGFWYRDGERTGKEAAVGGSAGRWLHLDSECGQRWWVEGQEQQGMWSLWPSERSYCHICVLHWRKMNTREGWTGAEDLLWGVRCSWWKALGEGRKRGVIRRCREAQSRDQQPHPLQEASGCPPGLFSLSVELIDSSSTSSVFLLTCREKKHLHCLESEKYV